MTTTDPTDPTTEDTPDQDLPDDETDETDETTDDETEPREPVTGDELVEAVANRRNEINPATSSYDQGRHEELTWVLDLVDPPEPRHEELEDENAEVSEDEVEDDDGLDTEQTDADPDPLS
jgi:hypothetical protein